jgi:hypothetical protein
MMTPVTPSTRLEEPIGPGHNRRPGGAIRFHWRQACARNKRRDQGQGVRCHALAVAAASWSIESQTVFRTPTLANDSTPMACSTNSSWRS